MRLAALLILWPAVAVPDSATVRVRASIASWAEVWADADCAGLESNEPDVIAWADDVPLVVGEAWCRDDGVRWAVR